MKLKENMFYRKNSYQV